MSEPAEHHGEVPRTARYATLGDPAGRPDEVWFACHGFGQLARYFIQGVAAIAGPTRLIVAPEALSRCYLGESTGATSRQARVGAVWMTREDRLSEIGDQVRYLDTLHAHVLSRLGAPPRRIVALGFSQGAATAARWIVQGTARVDEAILWGGRLPDEIVDPASLGRLATIPVTFVLGTADEFATPAVVAAERERVARLGLSARWVGFAGGHGLDEDTLLALAG